MAMKLVTLLLPLLSLAISIVAGDNSNIVGASWSADQIKKDSTEESQYISLPENPESYIALPGSPESYIKLPESEETTTTTTSDDDDQDEGNNFMLAKKAITCDKFPPICRKKSSPGPDCCKKTCTNIKKDPLNCGRCGRKCKNGEICCKGQCVNTSTDTKNCGSCGKKCKKWETCVYGMCSYA